MLVTNINEAKTHLSRLIERVGGGEEIIIAKAGKPVAKIIPYDDDDSPRKSGYWRGKVTIAEDFDVLPDDLLAGFYDGKI